MATPPVRYFAPTFFTPFYFPSLAGAGGGPPASGPPYRDRDAFASIVSALQSTGEFAGVSFGATPVDATTGADLSPAAVVTPDAWFEADDADPAVAVRHVSFALTLLVRNDDPTARYDALDRLTGLAQNAIDGSDLGGGCLPALTLLRRGRFDPNSKFPEQGVILHGEFAYLISSLTDHSVNY